MLKSLWAVCFDNFDQLLAKDADSTWLEARFRDKRFSVCGDNCDN